MTRYKFIISLLLFLVLIGCGTNLHIKKTQGKITPPIEEPTPYINGSFYIGGFLGNSYFIKIKNNSLSYAMTNNNSLKRHWIQQTLSQKDIYNFEKTLKSLNVINWENEYFNQNTKDGTQWLFHYKSSNVYVQSKGSNSYPENFKKLTKYISNILLKGKKFE